MNNQELLEELSARIVRGEIEKSEVERIVGRLNAEEKVVVAESKVLGQHWDLTKILSIIGGLIILLGILFFTGQVWDNLGSVGRIGITFILGLIVTGLGSALLSKKERARLGNVFHIVGAILLLGGSFVAMNELGWEFTAGEVSGLFGMLFLFHLFLTMYHKSTPQTFFAIFTATGFLYALAELLIPGYSYEHADMYAYLTMLFGVSYLLLSRQFQSGWNVSLVGWLNFFGTLGVLVAGASRAWDGIGFWEVFYFALLFGGMYLSLVFKSRAMLVLSVLFLVQHIIYITNQYFADSLGWPISLILLGFVILGLAYFSIGLNKKYLK